MYIVQNLPTCACFIDSLTLFSHTSTNGHQTKKHPKVKDIKVVYNRKPTANHRVWDYTRVKVDGFATLNGVFFNKGTIWTNMGDRPHLLSGDTRWCNLVKNHSSRAVGVLVIKTHSYGHDCCSWDQLDSWHHYQNLVWSSKHEVHNECIPFWMSISATIIYPRLFDQVTSSKRSGSADAVSVTFSKWWENKATSCTWKKQRNIWRHDHSVIQPRIGIPV